MKPKIFAAGNESLKGEFNISYYIVQKDESFLDWLSHLLTHVLEINGNEKAKFIVKRKDTEEGDWVENEVYIKEIEKMVDVHEKYENKGDRIDIFYGKDRVFITLRKSSHIRKKFADFVRQTKDWVEVKKVQNVPFYVKKLDKPKVN